MNQLHDMDVRLNWCRRCGRPMDELFEEQIGLCDGLPGVIHQRYLKAKQAFDLIFQPIIDTLLGPQ